MMYGKTKVVCIVRQKRVVPPKKTTAFPGRKETDLIPYIYESLHGKVPENKAACPMPYRVLNATKLCLPGYGLRFAEKIIKEAMIEKQTINGKDVWLKVEPYHVERSNPNIIPTEYFTASYFLQEPTEDASDGKIIKDEDGEVKLFESPVAALTYAWKNFSSTV